MYHIDSCTQTLEKLRMILDRHSTTSAKIQRVETIKQKFLWPFTSSEVKTLLAEIERHKTTLGLALNADGISGFLQSLSIQSAIRDSVDEIKVELRQRHEVDTRVAINSKRQSLLESFGKLDPGKNQKMSLKLRQPGTGLWLLGSQEFQDWSRTENTKLWLCGIPGAGKTVLAATIIEEALRTSSPNHAVAFFYCDYKDPATQNPSLILGSLIQQLAKQDEQSFEKVQNFCDTRNPNYSGNFDYDCQELRDLIHDIILSFDHATIIVDGLDECGTNATEVTELLASLNPKDTATNIKTLFLSREEVDISECLGHYVHVAIAARSSDLRLYVGAELDSRVRKKKLRIRDNSLKDYIMEKLVEGADGMYASLSICLCYRIYLHVRDFEW
ncbi:MAG: hypothetical protein Q9181_005397 [Wetmoreana brouardii]